MIFITVLPPYPSGYYTNLHIGCIDGKQYKNLSNRFQIIRRKVDIFWQMENARGRSISISHSVHNNLIKEQRENTGTRRRVTRLFVNVFKNRIPPV